MNNYLGISFSGKGLNFVHTRENTLNAVEMIPYPFLHELKELFTNKFTDEAAKIIRDKKKEYDAEDLHLKVALPSQFAFLKKVAIPSKADNTTIFEQMKWELGSYLPDKIEKFKVIKTDIEYDFETYKEALVICIGKSIITSLKDLADKAEVSLSGLVLETFCLERFMKNNGYLAETSNAAVIKIDTYELKTDIYINGKYYISIFEPLQGITHDVPLEERIQDISKQHLGKMESHLEFIPFVKQKELNLFVHGCGLNEPIYNTLQSAFNQELTRLQAFHPQIENMDMNNISLEALGVVNYRINI